MSEKRGTPIHLARNFGPMAEEEFRAIGIHTLEELRKIGWEEACIRLAEAFWERLNLNAFYAIIGAIDDVDWRKISPSQKADAKRLKMRLQKEFGIAKKTREPSR